MDFYGIGVMELIYILKNKVPDCRNVWYADDSAAAGKANDVKLWWETLNYYGPRIGYFPQPEKTCLVIKDPSKVDLFKSMFPEVNVTADGHRYLGSFIGTQPATEQYVTNKVKEWVQDIEDISSAAASEPQLAFAGYYFGTTKKWNFLMRTTPNIAALLSPIEKSINNKLLPALTGMNPVPDTLREVFSLSPKNGGLGIANPTKIADSEYTFSTKINQGLIKAIIENNCDRYTPDRSEILKNKQIC